MRKEVSYKKIKELNGDGILFADNTVLQYSQCDKMENSDRCIALRDIIGNPPYFDFFYPTKDNRLRIVFEDGNEKAFHKLYFHILDNGYQSYDLS